MLKLGIQKKYALTVSIFLTAILSIGFWSIVGFVSALTQENIQKQQYAMTVIIARSVDDKLGTWLVALADIGRTVPEDAFRDRDKAQQVLDQISGIESMFGNGIMLLNKNCEVVAENPYNSVRSGKKAAELESFLRSVEKNGLPDISTNPYPSPNSSDPAIVMAVPINDRNDNLLGFLAGSINLTSDYFIEELMGFKIGKKGYLYLISKDRTMIVHPDKKRIMKHDLPPGRNKLLDKALLGFEGSGETVNSRGVEQLVSFKSLRMVDWVLGCAFPKDEAYAPAYRLRTYLLTASALVLVFTIALVWALTSKITSNLKSLASQVSHIGEGAPDSYKITIDSNDEVGLLATTFNHLLTRLSDKERALVLKGDQLQQQALELTAALEQVKVLSGIIPICAWCKKIRNDNGYWDQLELYISQHSDADFTHAICPECYEQQVDLMNEEQER
ncbi:MAG: cache domain-containing protein [Oryzomonas sp.]|jgi:HAMP domain-containing protein